MASLFTHAWLDWALGQASACEWRKDWQVSAFLFKHKEGPDCLLVTRISTCGNDSRHSRDYVVLLKVSLLFLKSRHFSGSWTPESERLSPIT